MSFNAEHNDYSFEGPVTRHTASVKPRIAVFTRSYPPAYLKGGPTRSLHALVEALASEFRFSVVTSASDGSATGPMQSVEPSRWSTFGCAAIWYESRRHMPARTVVKLLRETDPQLIYLNSLFDYCFAILPLLIARTMFWKVPIILAPRGELSAGALGLKGRKKRAFMAAFRLLKLHEYVSWHASTSKEKADIERVFGPRVRSHVAIDLRTDLFGDGVQQGQSSRASDGPQGSSLIFLSRIVPKKNVVAVIRAMLLVKGNAHLSIAGPIEDVRYWNRCLKLINDMPDPRLIRYVGVIPADEVVTFLSRFDLFVLPTLGENFGHVVLESLAAGTPVIVGNDTPWHRIEASGAGWVCDPTNPGAIAELIERFLSLDEEARERMRIAAHSLAIEVVKDPSGVNANRSMFHALTCTSRRDDAAFLGYTPPE
jgi:glycosyltransferase involved in cell wall biosynthesis